MFNSTASLPSSWPYSDQEQHALIEARLLHPNTPQRTLARILFEDAPTTTTSGRQLLGRSEQSIYAALRRCDKKLESAGV